MTTSPPGSAPGRLRAYLLVADPAIAQQRQRAPGARQEGLQGALEAGGGYTRTASTTPSRAGTSSTTSVGALLAAAAIAVDLPMVLLVILSALGGASAITTGVMLLAGTIDTGDSDDDDLTARAGDGWWWYAIYIGLAVAGIIIQTRDAERLRRSVRASWAAERG